jgi:hypothetical protein
MAPSTLISLPGNDVAVVDKLTPTYVLAKEWANNLLTDHFNELEKTLIARIQQNYADYRKSLDDFGTRELIDMASTIHAYSDAHSYLCYYHNFTDEELLFLSRFANPLQIVAEQYRNGNLDVGEVEFSLDFIMEPERQKNTLAEFPLYEAPIPVKHDTIVSEKEKSPAQQLYNKMSDEFEMFLAELKTKPPKEIIQASYEKVFKEDLLLTVENAMDFCEDWDGKANALLALDRPLAHLYNCWLYTDVSYMDMLRDCVENEVDFLLSEQEKEQVKQEPDKPQSLAKPTLQNQKQAYTLLGDLRETQAEVNAKRAEKTAVPAKTKTKIQEEIWL